MKKIISKVRNPKVFFPLIGAIIVLLIVGGTIFSLKRMNRVFIEDSLISAPVVAVTPTTPGKLKTVYVTEGQMVRKGDVLAAVGSEVLHAYSDGVVIDTDKEIGSTASLQTAVVTLANPAEMRVDGTIDENKGLNQIKVGQVVSFTVDALPGETFWGYVDEVAQTAKQTQAAFSISSERPTQQFDVYVRFDAVSHPEVKNGMSAKMTVFTK